MLNSERGGLYHSRRVDDLSVFWLLIERLTDVGEVSEKEQRRMNTSDLTRWTR